MVRRRGIQNPSQPTASQTNVKGAKKVNRPSASTVANDNATIFHTSSEDVAASASAVQVGPNQWALHDTGATHHVFKKRKLFDDASFKSSDTSSKRLKLSGGDVSLNVVGQRTVKLRAGDGTKFELRSCLLIPELSRTLVAGGLLKAKGVRELYDDGDPTAFLLVQGSTAIFNGYIRTDNLMHLKILPVSEDFSLASTTSADLDHDLVHRRLGHLSDHYLKTMCKHQSVGRIGGGGEIRKPCNICLVSKASKIPSNHTRPRAKRSLENVHVDLSGIMRVKGLKNEMYYILFTNDFLSYRHIFPLTTKSKEEVYGVFKAYIVLAEI